MDAVSASLLHRAEHLADGNPTLQGVLQALRERLGGDGAPFDGRRQWDQPAAIDLLPGDRVIVGGVERTLIAAERGLRDGWVLLGWTARGDWDESKVWLADETHVWRHLQSPLDEAMWQHGGGLVTGSPYGEKR